MTTIPVTENFQVINKGLYTIYRGIQLVLENQKKQPVETQYEMKKVVAKGPFSLYITSFQSKSQEYHACGNMMLNQIHKADSTSIQFITAISKYSKQQTYVNKCLYTEIINWNFQ